MYIVLFFLCYAHFRHADTAVVSRGAAGVPLSLRLFPCFFFPFAFFAFGLVVFISLLRGVAGGVAQVYASTPPEVAPAVAVVWERPHSNASAAQDIAALATKVFVLWKVTFAILFLRMQR